MVTRPSAPPTPPTPIPLRAPTHRAHTLPLQPTPLIGRDAKIAELGSRLLDPDVRLLTLTGPPGTGKTRLAIAVADHVSTAFADGVWFVGLESVREPDQVVAAIAQTLGVREVSGQPLPQTLATSMAARQLLLLLDNFEQVLPAAGQVAELLTGSPGLTVLVTSRTPLRLRWEHEAPVAPLALPGPVQPSDVTAVGQSPAVELFRQRAVAARPDFALSASNAADVARVCAALDGLPLAIELAAARVKLLPPYAILERLAQRLALLTGGPHDTPDRHRTLRAAIAWSYDLLSPGEQTLFRQMGSFVGGCSLEAAEAVAEGVEDGEAGQTALDRLFSLADQSLLRRDTAPSSEPRLRMLETIREFAREQLAATGELADTQQRHAAYFLALAEAAEPNLAGPEQAAWLGRLEDEHDNLRAALVWAVAQGEVELGLRLGGALWRFWHLRGHLSEGRRYLAALLARPSAAGQLAIRTKALHGAGNLAMFQGDFVAARALHEESLQLRREVGHAREVAATLNNLGIIAQVLGEYTEARRLHKESLALKRELGDRMDIASSLSSLGNLACQQGDYATAHALYTESLAMRRELHDESGTKTSLLNLANVAYFRGEYAPARTWLEESLAIARALGDQDTGPALNTLGAVALRQGDHDAARSYLEQALATATGRGDRQSVSYALEAWAALAASGHQPERAARLFGAAEALRERLGITMTVGDRELHDRDVTATHAALDEATFAAAWAAGRAMPLETAVAYARDEDQPHQPVTDGCIGPAASPVTTQQPASLPAGLSAREVEVLRLLAAGCTSKEIAAQLVLSVHTVERHIANLYAKIGARRRADATAYAFRHRLTESPTP